MLNSTVPFIQTIGYMPMAIYGMEKFFSNSYVDLISQKFGTVL